MATYKVLDSNIVDKQSYLNLLRSYVFGNGNVELYDENRVYNTGEQAYIINDITGSMDVISAKEDGVTGPFDYTKWVIVTLTDSVANSMDSAIAISETRPTSNAVKIWFAPVAYSEHNIPDEFLPPPPEPEPTPTMYSMIFTDDIPIVEDTSTADLSELNAGDLVFDWEGEGEYISSTIDSFDDAAEILVDEQEDVHVGDDAPPASDPAFVWVDTDPSDDV